MSNSYEQSPRVRLRLSTEDDPDAGELPFVLGVVGDLSGMGTRGLEEVPLNRRQFHSSRPTGAGRFGDGQPLDLSDFMRRMRPGVALEGLFFAPGACHLGLEPVDAGRARGRAAETPDDPLHRFTPGGIALAVELPALRTTTLLHQGLLQARLPGPAKPEPEPGRQAAMLATICRRAAAAGLGDPRIDALPDPIPHSTADVQLLELASWLDIACMQQAAARRQPVTQEAGRGVAALVGCDLAELIRDSFVPALWRLLREAAGRRPMPWDLASAPLPLRCLLDPAPEELRQVLLGRQPSEAAHLGWLAACLEAAAGEMITAVLRHPQFQAMEANWRAIAHLLELARAPGCEIRLLDMAKEAVREDLTGSSSEAKSRLHQLIHGEGLGALGAFPQTMLLCLFDLEPDARDAELALRLARLGRSAICPVICSASRSFLDEALMGGADSRKLADWRATRGDEAAAFLGLCAPHLLARGRHRTDPTQAAPIRYEEPGSAEATALPWTGGAVGLAQRALVAFQRFNWHVAVAGTAEDHGVVTPLARAPFDDAALDRPGVSICLTEAQQEAARQAGLAAMVHLPGRGAIAFLDAPSLFDPLPVAQGVDSPDRAERRLASRLPYTFAGTRVGHHLLWTLRQALGQTRMGETDLEALANRWLSQYVAWQSDPATLVRAEKPLRRARAEARSDSDQPGLFSLHVALRPHFQVDGLGVDFTLADSMVVAAPSGAATHVKGSQNVVP